MQMLVDSYKPGLVLEIGTTTITGVDKYSKMVNGKLIAVTYGRVVGTSERVMFNIIERNSELFLYVDNSETPKQVTIRTFNVQMEMGISGKKSEAVIGLCIQHAKLAIKLMTQLFQTGYGFSVEDFYTALEMEEVIDYKGIERLARRSIN